MVRDPASWMSFRAKEGHSAVPVSSHVSPALSIGSSDNVSK